jgi:hypothetical protein
MSNFKGLDLMISYDTTGSMYPVLTQTKTYIEKTVKNLFGNIPDIYFSFKLLYFIYYDF